MTTPPDVAGSRPRHRWTRRILAFFAAGLVVFTAGQFWIEHRSRGRIFTDLTQVPADDVALVLGTSNRTRGGYENPFFAGRIAAAAELYHAGKARHLLLSGDNSREHYDEPTLMREALMKHGVPEAATTLDFAGFRTLDSFARAKKVFGVNRLTIVTDDFHAARAILLARHFGLEANAYTSRPVPLRWSTKTRAREVIARIWALLDVYLLRTKPRFLGPPVSLPKA